MIGAPFAIDHLMIRTADSEAAGEAFAALGFAVTPRSLLPGLSNRLICFPAEDDRAAAFLELISVDDPKAAPEAVRDLLGPNPGPAAVVLATDDAGALAGRLAGRPGIAAPRDFARAWRLGDEVLALRFAVLIAGRESAPLRWCAIQHRTPEHYHRPEFLRHAIGPSRLAALLVASEDPGGTATELAGLWGGAVRLEGPDASELWIGSRAMRIATPARLEDRYGIPARRDGVHLGGAVLQVKAPTEAAAILQARGATLLPAPRGSFTLPADSSRPCPVVLERTGT
jgi:hypothetical protein